MKSTANLYWLLKQGNKQNVAMAVIYIHYLTDFSLDDVVDLFAKKQPRGPELGTLLQDQQQT